MLDKHECLEEKDWNRRLKLALSYHDVFGGVGVV